MSLFTQNYSHLIVIFIRCIKSVLLIVTYVGGLHLSWLRLRTVPNTMIQLSVPSYRICSHVPFIIHVIDFDTLGKIQSIFIFIHKRSVSPSQWGRIVNILASVPPIFPVRGPNINPQRKLVLGSSECWILWHEGDLDER